MARRISDSKKPDEMVRTDTMSSRASPKAMIYATGVELTGRRDL